jgi:hypothetical protein
MAKGFLGNLLRLIPSQWRRAQNQIFAHVESAYSIQTTDLRSEVLENSPGSIAWRPLTTELAIVARFHADPAKALVTAALLERWGITTEDLFQTAIENTSRHDCTLESAGSGQQTLPDPLQRSRAFIGQRDARLPKHAAQFLTPVGTYVFGIPDDALHGFLLPICESTEFPADHFEACEYADGTWGPFFPPAELNGRWQMFRRRVQEKRCAEQADIFEYGLEKARFKHKRGEPLGTVFQNLMTRAIAVDSNEDELIGRLMLENDKLVLAMDDRKLLIPTAEIVKVGGRSYSLEEFRTLYPVTLDELPTMPGWFLVGPRMTQVT